LRDAIIELFQLTAAHGCQQVTHPIVVPYLEMLVVGG
jgi:hypothetical protein